MEQFNFKSIFFFDAMITPKVITFIYWLVLALIALAAVLSFANGVMAGVVGIISAVFLAIFQRVMFELIIIAFKNNEYLKKIAEKE